MPATGPTTPEGKAIASRNHTTHGLGSTAIVLPDVEDAAEWQTFSDRVRDAMAPAGGVEEALVARLAGLLWRIRRVPAAERQMVEELQYNVDKREYNRQMRIEAERRGLITSKNFYETVPIDIAFDEPPARVLPSEEDVNVIVRYEGHLNRQIKTTLHQIEVLQRRRNGEYLPLTRVELSANADQ
jgi:hypothetical protein